MTKIGDPVTITLPPPKYENNLIMRHGTIIKAGKSMWFLSPQRIKNKKMVARLLKKVFTPYFKITNVDNSQPYQHTFTLKPFNF